MKGPDSDLSEGFTGSSSSRRGSSIRATDVFDDAILSSAEEGELGPATDPLKGSVLFGIGVNPSSMTRLAKGVRDGSTASSLGEATSSLTREVTAFDVPGKTVLTLRKQLEVVDWEDIAK